MPADREANFSETASSVSNSWYGERNWRCMDDTDCGGLSERASHWQFSVMTYNILADNYAHHFSQWLYRDVPKFALGWQYRKEQLVKEIVHWSPDIVLMQEVQHFSDIEGELNNAG
eukprot:gene20510-27300_t